MRRMRDASWALIGVTAVAVAGAGYAVWGILGDPGAGAPDPLRAELPVARTAEETTRAKARAGLGRGERREEGEEGADPTARRVKARAVKEQALAITGQADCETLEHPGAGPAHTRFGAADWSKVMAQFHGAKADLSGWLLARKSDVGPELESMLDRIANLKIQRPPTPNEPDVSWRGLGTWSYDDGGNPIVRLGPGYFAMLEQQPVRARFEMTRLVAQTLAPCQLLSAGVKNPWNPLLSCLAVAGAQACTEGSYSEAGWAVSTALAAAVAPPGCRIGGLAEAHHAGCFHRPQFARTPAAVTPVAPGVKGSKHEH